MTYRFAITAVLACTLAAATVAVAQTAPTTRPGGRGMAARGPMQRAPQSVDPRDALPYTPGDFSKCDPKLPTLVIAGDSTADKGPDAWHRGWAAPLIDYFDTSKINVVNRARGGRSFRTFVHEGLWDQLVSNLKPGDIVMIQFGWNDGGDINSPNSKDRPDLPGLGDETQEVTRSDGTKETVHTFGWYTRKFVNDVRAKGATPYLMTTTPASVWKDGKIDRKLSSVNQWTREVAAAEKVPLIDHTDAIDDELDKLGQDKVKTFHPADFLHTATPGAIVNAEAFVAAVKGMDIKPLVDDLTARGQAIPAWTAPATEPAAH
ncbi:MAG TPA: rhamnogalacturonan acetylesterase [Phycisphaerae bacterium]|nr:rhamnogalacturonan acetylesterase [Phycisphaerae bacterium]